MVIMFLRKVYKKLYLRELKSNMGFFVDYFFIYINGVYYWVGIFVLLVINLFILINL